MKPLKVVQNAGVLYIFTCKCASRYNGVPFFHIDRQFFTILTWKCASRYSGVQFFHIWTSKSGPRMLCFVHFNLKMCFSLQRRAIFISPLNSYLRTRFTEVTFRPSRPTNHWKTQHFATSLTFRAIVASFYWLSRIASFYWLSRNCIFFLLTLLLFSAFSSSDSATLLCFFNCPYCRKLDF